MVNSRKLNVNWGDKVISPKNKMEFEIMYRFVDSNPRIREFFSLMRMLKSTYFLVQNNYFDLFEFAKNIDTPENQISLINDDEQGRIIYSNISMEFTRFLHNLLASFGTYIDITRNISKSNFLSKNFQKKYQCEIDLRFKTNVQANFLKDLRNYMLHRDLAIIKPVINFTPISDTTLISSIQINLSISSLLEGKNWTEYVRV